MMKYSFSFLHHSNKIINADILSIYSFCSSIDSAPLLDHLKRLTNKENICIIGGNVNIKDKTDFTHCVVSELLGMGFEQFIDALTHRDGCIIDHLYIDRPRLSTGVIIDNSLFASFYSDHFGMSIVIDKGASPFFQTSSTVPDYVVNAQNETATKNQGPAKPSESKCKSSTKQSHNAKRLRKPDLSSDGNDLQFLCHFSRITSIHCSKQSKPIRTTVPNRRFM